MTSPTEEEGERVLTSRTCSWCHASNSVRERYCHKCGHEAQVPRLDCRCRRCLRDGAVASDQPAQITAADIEAVIARLRRQTTAKDTGACPNDERSGPASGRR
jgi:predicted amidophosphoribosyltransferase